MMRPLCLLPLLLTVACSSGESTTPYPWDLPSDFPDVREPDDNRTSVEGVELGRHLFFDVRLSGNQTQACGGCHVQVDAFTDRMPVGIGSTGEMTPRNSMNLTNVAYNATYTWANPVVRTLEDQALGPMFGETPVELGLAGREQEMLDRLRADEAYQLMFAAAFPRDDDAFTVQNVTKAIAQFERTLISHDSPYDRFVRGDVGAMSESAQRGMDLFFTERVECFHCHGGFNFTSSVDHSGNVFDQATFHNNGLFNIDGRGAYPEPNTGLFAFTEEREDMGRFRPPTLRNIELTAPYMHDGSIATLEGVIDHYAAGGRNVTEGDHIGDGRDNPNKSIFVGGFELTDSERQDLLAFLRALTDRSFVENPAFRDPFAD